MLISYKLGQGSIVLRVKIRNSSVSTGAGLTGLTSGSSGLLVSTIADNEATATAYSGSNIESITTLGTFSAPTSGKVRFKEVDSTNHKGIYEIQIADARYNVSSSKSVLVSISGATNAAECDVLIPLRSVDPYDGTRFGMTALPNAAAEASGGLYTRGSGAGQITQDANGRIDVNVKAYGGSAGTFSGGRPDVNVSHFGGTAGTFASGRPEVNTTHIAGSSVSTASAQIGVNVVNAGGTAWASGSLTRAVFAADTGLQTIRSNTAQAGASGSITLDAGASSTTDFYKYCLIYLTGGTGAGQYRLCTAYNGGTKVATVAPNWITNPDNTSTFAVLSEGLVDVEAWMASAPNALQSGRVDAYLGATGAVTVAANVTQINAVSTSSVTTINANIGVTQPINFTGTGASALVKSDTVDIAGAAVSTSIAQIGVNVVNFGGSAGTFASGRPEVNTTHFGGTAGTFASGRPEVNTTHISGSAVSTANAQIGVNVVNAGGTAWASGSITAAVIADAAIDRATFAADTGMQTIRSNTAQAGSSTSITLDAGASSTTDFYKGRRVYITGGVGAGQDALITAYNGGTKVATTTPAWITNPDNTSTFAVEPNAMVDLEAWESSVPNVLQSGRVDAYVGGTGAVTVTANVTQINGVSTSSVTTVNANIGTTQPINFTGSGGSALVKSDMVDIAGAAVSTSTAQIGVNVVNFGGSAGTFASGRPEVNMTHISGATVSTSTAQLGVNVVNFGGSAGTFASGRPEVNTTHISGSAVSTAAAQIGVNVVNAAGTAWASGAITAAVIADGAIDRATFAADTGMQTIRSGTAQAGTSGSITLDAGASAANDFYKNRRVYITGGLGAGQDALITAYDGATKVATITPTWVTNPDNTSTFAVEPNAMVDVEVWRASAPNALQSGRVDAYVGAMGTDTITSGALSAGAVTEIQSAILSDATPFAGASIAAIKTVTDNLATMYENVSGYRWTTHALMQAPSGGGTPPTVFEIADQVWDEILSGHAIAGSAGAALTAAGTAGDPWTTNLPGAYASGTAGYIIGNRLDALISSRLAPTVAGRTLDVTATGEAGIDWANVGGQSTSVNLSNTTVHALDVVNTNGISSASLTAGAISAIQAGLSTLTADQVWQLTDGVEQGLTPRHAMQLIVSATACLSSNSGQTFLSFDQTKNRITGTVSAANDRVVVSYSFD